MRVVTDIFTPFLAFIFETLSEFLMSEPMIYFVALYIILFIARIFFEFINFGERR